MKVDSLLNLVGTWRLVSCEARTASGEIRYPLGQHVVGQLFYGVSGNMSAHVMRVDRPTFASDESGSGTDAEVRAAFERHTSYFGTYTIDPSARTVTHHVRGASYLNWMSRDQIRYYRIDGSHLVLSTPPILDRGESLEYTLTLGTDITADVRHLPTCCIDPNQAVTKGTDIPALLLRVTEL